MLPRGPDYFFKPEDIEFIKTETGKEKGDIQYWARQFRWKMGINKLPGGLNAEDFTKKEISHLEEITQTKSDEIKTSVVEINEKIDNNYRIALANQALTISDQGLTIKKYQEIITKQQVTIASLSKSNANNEKTIASLNKNIEKQQSTIALINKDKEDLKCSNERQRFQIAKLNAERDQTASVLKKKDQNILRLNEEIQRYHSDKVEDHITILNQYKELMTKLQDCKKRKRDDI